MLAKSRGSLLNTINNEGRVSFREGRNFGLVPERDQQGRHSSLNAISKEARIAALAQEGRPSFLNTSSKEGVRS
jgi:hypothetical protein